MDTGILSVKCAEWHLWNSGIKSELGGCGMGKIVIDDDFKDWEWFRDRNTLSVFMYLLLNANTEDKKDRGIDVPRGSIKTSVSEISNHFNMSAKEVRTAIKHLNGANKVASKTFNKGTIFSIVEYDSYLDKGKQKGKQRASKGQARNRKKSTAKERKLQTTVRQADCELQHF